MRTLFAEKKTMGFSGYPPCTTHDHRHGFTLIELLVVISIISLLLGISFPVLTRARYQARTLLGTSHQRQIVRAVGLYAMDNQDRYPESVATIGDKDHWNWQEPTLLTGYRKRAPQLCRSMSAYLGQYIHDGSVMSCPHAPKEHQYLQRAWEAAEDWGNPDAPIIKGPLTGTYCFYWNYTGLLTEQMHLFRGPTNLSGGFRESTVLVSCYFGYDNWRSRNAYSSCNKFRNASPTEETWFSSSYWAGPSGDDSLDTLDMKLRAGYTDEHVESFAPSEVVPMEVIMDRSTAEPYPSGVGPGIFYLPYNSLH